MDAQVVGKKMGIELFTWKERRAPTWKERRATRTSRKKWIQACKRENCSEQDVNVHYLGRVSLPNIREESLFQIP